MPTAAKKPCYKAGCPEFATINGYCDKHQTVKREADKQRGNANDRGYGYKWRKESKKYKEKNPLCVKCLSYGRIEPSTDVDHIKVCKGDESLFWQRSNWQALCKSCHSRKTASEDMGVWTPSSLNKNRVGG